MYIKVKKIIRGFKVKFIYSLDKEAEQHRWRAYIRLDKGYNSKALALIRNSPNISTLDGKTYLQETPTMFVVETAACKDLAQLILAVDCTLEDVRNAMPLLQYFNVLTKEYQIEAPYDHAGTFSFKL